MSECLAVAAASICTSIVEYSIFSNRIIAQQKGGCRGRPLNVLLVWCQTGVGVRSTVDFPARGGPAFPPPLLFRNLSSPATDWALSPIDHAAFRRRGASSRLRVGGFICCTGSPGVWGPSATNSLKLAVAEINKRGGILGREIELSIYDAGGPLDEVLHSAEQAIAFDE